MIASRRLLPRETVCGQGVLDVDPVVKCPDMIVSGVGCGGRPCGILPLLAPTVCCGSAWSAAVCVYDSCFVVCPSIVGACSGDRVSPLPPTASVTLGSTLVRISITVGVLVVIITGGCSVGLGTVIVGANPCPPLPPIPSLFHSPHSSHPVADTSGCQKGGGSSHQSGGSAR